MVETVYSMSISAHDLDALDVEVDYSVPLMERPIEQLYYSVLTEEEKKTYTPEDLQTRFFRLGATMNLAVLTPLYMFGLLDPNSGDIIE